MQPGEKKKTCDSGCFRREYMTFWPRGDPVMCPHLHTDHWSKMKTMATLYHTPVSAALLKDTGDARNRHSSSLLPRLSWDEPAGVHRSAPKKQSLSQNRLQYRNVFNDHARRGFCYWLVDKKTPACKGYSFGAYKTYLGLPKF